MCHVKNEKLFKLCNSRCFIAQTAVTEIENQ